MIDKSIAIQAIIQVLKKEIVPHLNDDMAKEQAIALVSVLKNVDAITIQNEAIYRTVISHLAQQLGESLQRMNELADSTLKEKILSFEESLALILQKTNGDRNKWESLNTLFSEMIQFVYQNHELQPYVDDLRKIIRKQLDIEMTIVH